MLEKELDYNTMTPDILADFIFNVSGCKVNHANIKSRIESMVNRIIKESSTNNKRSITNFVYINTAEGRKKFYKDDIVKSLQHFDTCEADKTSSIWKNMAEKLYNCGHLRERK
jgi:hypothetical protein